MTPNKPRRLVVTGLARSLTMLFDVITGFNPVIYPLAAWHNLWIAGSSPAMTSEDVSNGQASPVMTWQSSPASCPDEDPGIQRRGTAFDAGSPRCARDDAANVIARPTGLSNPAARHHV